VRNMRNPTLCLLFLAVLQALKALQWGATTRSKASAETAGNREVSSSQTHGPQQGADGEGEMVSMP
jgi:hypothetical protein